MKYHEEIIVKIELKVGAVESYSRYSENSDDYIQYQETFVFPDIPPTHTDLHFSETPDFRYI